MCRSCRWLRCSPVGVALFRERGYDGGGVVELMAAAGLTHGGFYNQFKSKSALMSESAAWGFSVTSVQTVDVDLRQFIAHYLSREHRDSHSDGCTIAALSGDAARHDEGIKCVFEAGTTGLAKADKLAADNPQDNRAKILSMVAHLVGAVMLSRACPDDSPIGDEIQEACHTDLLSQLLGAKTK